MDFTKRNNTPYTTIDKYFSNDYNPVNKSKPIELKENNVQFKSLRSSMNSNLTGIFNTEILNKRNKINNITTNNTNILNNLSQLKNSKPSKNYYDILKENKKKLLLKKKEETKSKENLEKQNNIKLEKRDNKFNIDTVKFDLDINSIEIKKNDYVKEFDITTVNQYLLNILKINFDDIDLSIIKFKIKKAFLNSITYKYAFLPYNYINNIFSIKSTYDKLINDSSNLKLYSIKYSYKQKEYNDIYCYNYNLIDNCISSKDFDELFKKDSIIIMVSDRSSLRSLGINTHSEDKTSYNVIGYIKEDKSTKSKIILSNFKFNAAANITNILLLDRFSSSIREFETLINFDKLNFKDIIKNPNTYNNHNSNYMQIDDISSLTLSYISDNKDNVFYKFYDIFNYFNITETQLKEIINLLNIRNGIGLLQGPPGTGKTQVLITLISCIYSRITNKKKILVCAPSNNAVEEILLRLSKRITEIDDKTISPDLKKLKSIKLIKVGNIKIDSSLEVKKYGIDEIIKSKKVLCEKYKNKITELVKKRKLMEQDKSDNKKELKVLNSDISRYQEKVQKYSANNDNLKYQLISDADIVFSTLNSSACSKLDKFIDCFDTIIIDEACQATEPECIIPFKFNVNRVIMVGDPMQLPATTFVPNITDKYGIKNNYNISLFERFIKNGFKYGILTEQFRMLKEIREFPSLYFYNGVLTDSIIIENNQPESLKSKLLYNTGFFDYKLDYEDKDTMEKRENKSYYNSKEINDIITFLYFLKNMNINLSKNVSIITPYSAQVYHLRRKVKDFNIRVNTIDSFQGQEHNIIIFSCVRTNKRDIGFLKDYRRLNVAITRAKYGLFIFGNSESLISDKLWSDYITYMKEKNCYFKKIKNIFQKESK